MLRVDLLFGQIKVYEYPNKSFCVDVEHYYSHTPSFFHYSRCRCICCRLGHCRRRRRPPPSLLPPSPSPPSPVSARRRCRRRICRRLGHCWRRRRHRLCCRRLRRRRRRRCPATIAISAAIAAAFWLIVVCPRCCLCFRLPPPFLPAPAVATAAVCRRHCQCRRHRHRHHHHRPCSFRRHRCHHCLLFCRRHHCLYVSTFPTASTFQRFHRHGRRCLCFDRHRHHSSSLSFGASGGRWQRTPWSSRMGSEGSILDNISLF